MVISYTVYLNRRFGNFLVKHVTLWVFSSYLICLRLDVPKDIKVFVLATVTSHPACIGWSRKCSSP